ncbi:DUF4214 domain-containing protein [Agrobacterium rhizogenes]|nr:DUF4214 domain-containing protein [Rhizobium rhizogenes]NTG58014.1 DUF4214 domain-containing protein [Rhizobium rhizogenes]
MPELQPFTVGPWGSYNSQSSGGNGSGYQNGGGGGGNGYGSDGPSSGPSNAGGSSSSYGGSTYGGSTGYGAPGSPSGPSSPSGAQRDNQNTGAYGGWGSTSGSSDSSGAQRDNQNAGGYGGWGGTSGSSGSSGAQRDNQNAGGYGGWGSSSGATGGTNPNAGGDWNAGSGPNGKDNTRSPVGDFNGVPVLLDLSGDGLNIDPLSSSSQFVDINGDGYQHRTAWAGKGTGVLVFDADGNGKISQSKEFAFTEWDPSATGDLEAIKNVFDTNGNGKLDAGDAQWSKFRVMVDGQLVSLASLGITSIDLTAKGSGQTFSDGSAITGTTTYTKSDGTTGMVGDAVLASDSNGYIIKSTVVTNADLSTTKTILAYNADGSLAFQNLVTTGADGNTVQTKYDDDGNGTYDRSQTDVTTVATSGARTRVISSFNADSSLIDKTTTVTSADRLTVTTTLDQDGDAKVDQSQAFVTNADGSTTTTTKALSTAGTVLQQMLVQASADGLSKTTKTDINGDGTYDDVVSEVTVVATDSSRTKTVKDTSNNGTLLSNVVTTTSTNGDTRTVAGDLDGNGTVDQQEQTQRTVATNGDITTVVTTTNGDNSARGKVTTIAAANGLSSTVSTDITSDGVVDLVHSDVTTVAANGTRTQTVQDTSASGVLLSKSVTTTGVDGKTKTVSVDANGDGAADALTSITVATDGSMTQTDSILNPNSTLIAKTVTATSANGLSKTISTDLNGDGTFDRVTTDAIAAATGGARTETVTTTSANGTVIGKTVTTTSADSLAQTVQTDVNGDATFDQTVTDTIVLGSTGTRQETVAIKSSNGTLLQQRVTLVSTDRKTTTVTTDSDGDGHTDSTIVQIVAANGSQTTTTTATSTDGALHGKAVTTVSADGLTTTTVSDVNGDGVNDVTTVDQTVINADGSRTETVTDKSNTGVLLDKVTTVTSGNGLSTTVQADFNGDGAFDAKRTKVTTLNSDGSTMVTTTNYAGTTAIGQTKVTTTANGLVTKAEYNYDGNTTRDRVATSTKTLNADGSASVINTVTTSAGALLSKTTNTATADGKTVTSQMDNDGDGKLDVKTTTVIDATGQKTETVETYKAGTTTLSTRAVTVTSANGLSTKTSSDLDGSGVYELAISDVTTLLASGDRRQATTRSSNTAPIEQTSVTTSANGLAKTTVVSDDLVGATVRNEIYRLYRAILGRDPDVTGFGTFTTQFKSGTTAVQIATTLLGSPEFAQKYGTLTDLQFANLMYQNALGRAPEAGAAEAWVSAIAAGTTRASLAQQAADSPEGLNYTTGKAQAWALTNPDVVLSEVGRTRYLTTLNADGSTTETVTNTGLVANKTTTTISADKKTTTVTFDIDGNGVVDQKSVSVKNADGSITQTLSDLTSTGTTSRSKMITTSADGLGQLVSYDTDGNGSANKTVTDLTTLNIDGSKSTLEKVYVANSSGTLALSGVTQTDISADGLIVTTKWDQTGSGTFTKSRTDVTVLNADGSRTQTVSYLTGTTLTSRYLTTTSANGLSITTQSDPTGSGTYSQTSSDVTTINADGTRTRTVSSTKADGTVISKFVTTTSADGETVTTSQQRTGLATQSVSRTIEILADGAARETVSTIDSAGKLIDKTITLTSADKRTVTIERDINGDAVIDQRQQSVTEDSGVVTSTVTDYKSAGVKADGSTTTTTANGLQTTTNWDLDGNATSDRRRVVVNINNADGSWSRDISDTDLATGKLATKTTIQQSSDGMVRTTSKDVNGDGTVDQVETLTLDTTGVSVSILTNNAVARGASYLLPGIVYWKQAIAAKIETSSSADGRTKTIKCDYDGNGTFEVVMQSQMQIDGSVVATITETNASGAVIAKGTIATSTDGLITTLSKDSNNDGVIDHTETAVTRVDGSVLLTKVDRNASGATTGTIVDTISAMGSLSLRITSDGQGRKTSQLVVSGNGASVTTTYDAASGQTLSVANANKAGILTSAVFYDPLNANSWTRIEQSFDATGKKTLEKQFNDDSTRVEITFYTPTGSQQHVDFFNSAGVKSNAIDYDVTNANDWTRVEYSYDVSGTGKVTRQIIYHDDQSRNVYNYDVANTQGWSTYVQVYNAAGQIYHVEQGNDDGTKSAISYYTPTGAQQHIDYYNAAGQWTGTIDFDVTNAQSWSRIDNNIDPANGQVVSQTVYYDDGTRGVNYWDRTNAQSWSTINEMYNTAGQMTNRNDNYDDGSKVLYAFDVNNSQSWSYLANVYTSAGQLITENVYSDTAGTYTATSHDVNNNQGWTTLVQNFVNNVERTAKTYNDDGGYTNYQYDSSHNLTGWQRYAYQGGGGQNPYIMVAQWPEPNYGNRPVLLDLNGDGHIDLRPLDMMAWATNSSVTFDWNGDGARDGTAWVGPQDGFLAIDLGGDGQAGSDGVIDQSKELSFSEWATPEQVAANGGSVSDLDGLRLVFDSNHDNVLDANDTRWSEFHVWRDANQNGTADDGELLTMSEAGIKLINLLQTAEGSQSFADGSAITGTSSYQTADGTSHYLVGDATLVSQAAIPKQSAA